MMIILDAHISPSLANWISEIYNIETYSASFLKLQNANDLEIFEFAKQKNAIIITKDDNFLKLIEKFGSPPKIIWLTCGNTSKEKLKNILKSYLSQALQLLDLSDIVEISGN